MIFMATVYLLGLIVIQFAPDTGGKLLSDDDEREGGARVP